MASDSPTPNRPLRLQGQLLLADPSLRDGIFDRSVILLTEHTPTAGAFGLVLNHPTGKLVGDLLPGEDFNNLRKLPVHDGGPVSQDQLSFSAFWWSSTEGLRWEVRISAEDAMKHSSRPGTIVRAFLGYSGWTAGQLENELQHRSWIPATPNADLLGQDHDRSLWAGILRRLSPVHRILAEAPENPFLN